MIMFRVAAALALVLSCQSSAAQTTGGIQRAAFLQGCWELNTPARSVDELWTAPRGGTMIGVSRTIRDGKTIAHELIVMREDGDRLVYEAHPSGQAAATVLSTHISATELVFENPAHDFPQQVGYRLSGEALLAWIRGTQKGNERRIEYPYKRARCANP